MELRIKNMCFKYQSDSMHHLLSSPKSYSTFCCLGFWGESVSFRLPAVGIYAPKEVLMPNTTVLESHEQIHPLKNTILNSEIMISEVENVFKVIYICTQVILFS